MCIHLYFSNSPFSTGCIWKWKTRAHDWLKITSGPITSHFYPTPFCFPNSSLCLADKDVLSLLWILFFFGLHVHPVCLQLSRVISLYIFIALLKIQHGLNPPRPPNLNKGNIPLPGPLGTILHMSTWSLLAYVICKYKSQVFCKLVWFFLLCQHPYGYSVNNESKWIAFWCVYWHMYFSRSRSISFCRA